MVININNIIDLKVFANRLTSLIENSAETTYSLADKLSLTPATISRYTNGLMKPKVPTIKSIAQIFNVDDAWLMGYDVPMKKDTNKSFNIFSIKGVLPLPHTNKKPRLGAIACGEPILAEENIEDYDDVPDDMKCDFTLLCEGDSMINARIYDGDIVYIREQPQVENGEIAACLVDGEFETKATLKRFYKYDDKIILQAENPKYPPFVYVNEEMNRVRVIGKAVGFTSRL